MNPFRIERYDFGTERLSDGRIQIIEEFVEQEYRPPQYVRTTRSSFGCCYYEIVRDHWQPEEITRKMIKFDLMLVRGYRNEHRTKYAEGHKPPRFCTTFHVPIDDVWRKIFDLIDSYSSPSKALDDVATPSEKVLPAAEIDPRIIEAVESIPLNRREWVRKALAMSSSGISEARAAFNQKLAEWGESLSEDERAILREVLGVQKTEKLASRLNPR